MKKKKLWVLFLLMQLSTVGLWADSGKSLVVELQNDRRATFVLSENPTLTFADKVLQIEVGSKSNKFEIDNVKQFYFVDVSTGVIPVSSDELRVVSRDDNHVVLEGIGESDVVVLYSADGKVVDSQIEISGNRAEIPLASLTRGIYLNKVSNKQTFKIYRK